MTDQLPSKAQLSKYCVNRPGWEAIRQTLYDYQAYPAAGVQLLTFFTQPLGGAAARTLSDTNLTLSGQLPRNQEFLIQSIEVAFWPTTPTGANAADLPAAFGAQQAAVIINDVYIVYRSGHLVLTIGSKPYLQEAPLQRFPPKTRVHVEGALADQSTIAADLQSRIAYAYANGRPYILEPAALLLIENQNFNVTLNWPEGVQVISSDARIGVILDGFLYRRSQ